MKIILNRAPSTSALWKPKELRLVLGRWPNHIENTDTKNPIKSDSKWAASVIIDKLFAK